MSTGLCFTLEVDGLPPDAFAVVSFHLTQSLSSLFSLDLSLVSQQFLSLEFAQVLDKMAYLTVWQGDDVQRRVKGVVTWFELGENDKNQMLYSMKVRPPLWRAGLRQNFRIFQNEDIRSILGTILQENDVTEWSPLFSEPHPSREFCVQYGETDYDFLCRIAAEEGIFFYEEHAQKSTDQSLVLCDTVRYLPESFEIPWNPNTRTEVSTLCISQFRYSAQIRPSSVVTKDYTFKRPGWAGRFDQEGQHQDYQRTQYEVYDWPGRFKSAHGQNFARWQMDGWRNNAETARGMSRSPEIWPGRRIVLTEHPQANLNREWQVVASELHGEQPQAVPGRRGSGTTLNNHFAVIPADRTWRPQPKPKPSVDGPQSAVVTGPAGEEIFCDEHGRVRVKFNWDRYNPANQDSSCWIRVAQAWAGPGFGNLAIPRVGQEVIVDFLNGDPDQPIIMGRTYHEDNRSPGTGPYALVLVPALMYASYKASDYVEEKQNQLESWINSFCDTDGAINTGSENVKINGKPAARAAVTLPPPPLTEAIPSPPQGEPSWGDIATDLLESAAEKAVPLAKTWGNAVITLTDSNASFMDRVSAGASLLFPAGPVLMEFATMVGGRGEIKKDVDFPEAGEDTALCDKENKPPRIAQGSSNVFINNQPAARQGDKLECSAAIVEGSPDVFIGGEQVTYLDIQPEFPPWQRMILGGITIASYLLPPAGLLGKLGNLAKLGKLGNLLGKSGKLLGAKLGALLGKTGKSLKSIANKVIRWVTDPVDPVTGAYCDERTDFTLGQTLPLSFTRFHSSVLPLHGLTGVGWSDSWSEYAWVREQGNRVDIISQGATLYFAFDGDSDTAVNPYHAQYILRRRDDYLELFDRDALSSRFFYDAFPGMRLRHPVTDDTNDDRLAHSPGDRMYMLGGMSDTASNRITFERDSQYRITGVSHTDGIRLKLTYHASG